MNLLIFQPNAIGLCRGGSSPVSAMKY